MIPRWLEWVQELQAAAQNGLAYCQNPFDIERFKQIRRVAAEIAATYTGMDHAQMNALFEGEMGYATPKVDVRGAIIQGDQILLVEEIQDDHRWTLPGGWADAGDTPSEAVLREIREESGYEARVTKLAAVYDRARRGHPVAYFSAYKLFFLCEITGGQAAASIETGEARFFSEDALPELSLGRVTPQEIHMLFEHFRNPGLPTEYD